MMYQELHDSWRKELENRELQVLPTDFYSKLADYLRRLREEARMLDHRTAKAFLLEKETRNVKHMVAEMLACRRQKVTALVTRGEDLSTMLTAEENRVYSDLLRFDEVYRVFRKGIGEGRIRTGTTAERHGRVGLRFMQDIPSIIGADMKNYGPFMTEDVGSLPVQNAKILVDKNLAKRIEVP